MSGVSKIVRYGTIPCDTASLSAGYSGTTQGEEQGHGHARRQGCDHLGRRARARRGGGAPVRVGGAAVVLTDVLDADGEETAAEIGGIFLHHDVTSEEGWEGVVKEAVERHGKVDILVNNAGIYQNGLVTQMSLEDYRRVIDVNQVGVFLGMKHVAPAIIEAGGGAIVNISSIAGMRGGAGSVAYGASKWAVRGMTKVAAHELGEHGIRVNSIHPGLIETASCIRCRESIRATSIG